MAVLSKIKASQGSQRYSGQIFGKNRLTMTARVGHKTFLYIMPVVCKPCNSQLSSNWCPPSVLQAKRDKKSVYWHYRRPILLTTCLANLPTIDAAIITISYFKKN